MNIHFGFTNTLSHVEKLVITESMNNEDQLDIYKIHISYLLTKYFFKM